MAHDDFTHIDIPADDTARARRFYEGLFGWEFREMPGFEGYALFTTPAGQEGVGGGIGERGKTAPEAIRNYVAVDSIEASVAKVAGLGGSLVMDKTEAPTQGWYAVLRDPEGNEIALWEQMPS